MTDHVTGHPAAADTAIVPVDLGRPRYELATELREAWDRVAAATRLRAVVVRCSGPGSSAGVAGEAAGVAGEAAGVAGEAAGVAGEAAGVAGEPAGVPGEPVRLPGPVEHGVWTPAIAVIDGTIDLAALGLVAQCDIVVATAATMLRGPLFAERAGFGDLGGQILRDRLGAEFTRLALCDDATLAAPRAYELGFVNELAADRSELDALTDALVGGLRRNSPSAMAVTKQLLWRARTIPLDEGLRLGGKVIGAFWGHPDSAEGPRAFAERRPPRWRETISRIDIGEL
jgi:E-phenylitaconyl-CoA hydratase